MKKKLKFIISMALVLAISVCAFITPASSFQTDEITSSQMMLMINLDTMTRVYSLRSENRWYASYQSELMTFLLLTESKKDPAKVSVKVDEDFIDELDHSDGCLEQYYGEKLTLKDLGAIMLLTSGSDAANLIAYQLSDGDIDAFVKQMNKRAKSIKCNDTHFTSPGYSDDKDHLITCADLSRIFCRLLDEELFQEIMENPQYIPDQFGDDEDYAVTTENSIMNPRSPYYFRYTTGGKYAYDKKAGASLIITTSYQDKNYVFVAMRGKNEAEENVFSDARRMTTWAYLNLSDRKIIDTSVRVKKATAVARWGEYAVDLYADSSSRKTLPNEYDQIKFEVREDVPDKLDLPLFKGEVVGTASVYYDGERVDKANVIPLHNEGVSLLQDLGRYGGFALAKLFPKTPELTDEEAAEDAADDADDLTGSKAATEASKKKTVNSMKATEAEE